MIGVEFNNIDAQKAHEYVSQNVPEWFDENKAFVGVPDDYTDELQDIEADHWQDGKGFLAPLPPKGATRTVLLNALKNMFVVEDIIGDCLNRRCNGVLGKEPQWSIERLEQPEGDIVDEELEAVQENLKEWFSSRNIHGLMKRFLNSVGYGKRSYFRIYIPPARFKGKDSIGLSVSSPEDALKHIYVEHLERDQACMFTDRMSMEQVGIVVFEGDTEDKPIDPMGGQEMIQWAEMSYREGESTVLRITYSSDKDDQVFKGDLRGNLTIYQANHRLFITDSVKRNQKDLNTTNTQMRINNDNAAFQQRLFINLQPPGSMVTDENGNDVFKVGTYNKGPGQDLFLVSLQEEDAQGNVKYTSGDAKVLEPVDNQNLLRSTDKARAAIYRQCKQLHVNISGDATASGESRLQAQGEYLLDLMDMKGVMDKAGKWLLETVWALAEVLAGQEPTKDIKAVFDCRVNPGPLTSEMRRAIIETMEAGLISRATAMSMLGVDDVEAEKERLAQEAEEMGPEQRATVQQIQSQSRSEAIQSAFELFPTFEDADGNSILGDEAIEFLRNQGIEINGRTAPTS